MKDNQGKTPITFFSTLRKESNMNKSELILKTAQISGVSRKDVEKVLEAAVTVITAQLAEGGEATLPGLGKLSVTVRAARNGRNPANGETMHLPAKKVPHFGAAKALKDAVAQGQPLAG